MHKFLILMAVLSLAACGNRGGSGGRSFPATATGPISQACLAADRDAASPGLCGCIQAAANRSLSDADQRRAAAFFGDPHQAQETKASDSPSAEAFWARYRQFVSSAETLCTR